MSAKDQQDDPRIEDFPTLQIVEVEVPDRLKELETLVPFDPSTVGENSQGQKSDSNRWN